MQLSINDIVYKGQCSDINEAKKVLLSHAKNVSESSSLRAGNLILRTEQLKNKNITKDKTIYDVFILLQKSRDPEDRKLLMLLLTSFVKGPYIKFPTIKHSSLLGQENIDQSALSYCACNPITRAIVSPNIEGWQQDLTVKVASSFQTVKNYFCPKQIDSDTWKYESNPKHEIPKDIIVKGNVWSRMDLSDQEAQKLLSKSVKISHRRCSFAKNGGQWYQFYNHENNLYHGFPINNPGNDKDLNRVEKLLSDYDCTACGQLII
ncbi:hypothetical protein [Vibrio chagasii]|uniref:hypothetical protein n=1 Tax=Vibrio chagasii TaxID=170679 RepID=UPI003735EEB5